jgi:peroxiredoxin
MAVSAVMLAWLIVVGGCARRLKDDAPANTHVEASEIPSSLMDGAGRPVDLKSYRGKSVVLIVVRGIPESSTGSFCPYCLAQVAGLVAKYQEIRDRGAEVVLVYPGSGDRATEFLDRVKAGVGTSQEMPFPVCIDKDCQACDQLGIRGDLAKPSTFIIDPNGDVAYAYVGKSPSDRPSVAAVLKELDKIKRPPQP